MTITTPGRSLQLDTLKSKSAFPAEVLETIIRIDKAIGDDALAPEFFYYEDDHVLTDPQVSVTFFVVNGNRIVLDDVGFSIDVEGYNRTFFVAEGDQNDLWASWRHLRMARIRQWYRTFYQDTPAGRLTTFRDDVQLYYYEPDWKVQALIAERISQAARSAVLTNRLLVAVLVALALVLFRFLK